MSLPAAVAGNGDPEEDYPFDLYYQEPTRPDGLDDDDFDDFNNQYIDSSTVYDD